ncbi:MAG: peptidylprolyl isomerase [Hyphomonadaceae bacterium]|nr:peptidylprolyl isomerase [Hyphomonadaceae bacterium]
MKLKHVWAAAMFGAAALAGSGQAYAQLSESVAVIVNDDVISTYDVRQRAALLLVSAGMQSTPELQQRARAQAMRDLVDEHLQLQEAKNFDIAITPAEIDRRIADIAQSNRTTPEGLAQSLAAAGASIGSLRSQMEADIAWNRLMRGLYGNRVRVSEVEVRETQERIAASATRPQFLISEIFLPAETEQQFAEAQNGATQLLQEMQRGAPFPLVARQFSASASAAAGGDIGWIGQNELPAELQPLVEQLQPGQVSVPVRASNGVYLIAMRDRRAGAPAGSTSQVTLSQVTAPSERAETIGRVARRVNSCANLETQFREIPGIAIVDLGQATESDLSPAIRDRIAGVPAGSATAVQDSNGQASVIIVCSRQTAGGGVPTEAEISDRLFQQEMELLSERYLRNLRREATIIQR